MNDVTGEIQAVLIDVVTEVSADVEEIQEDQEKWTEELTALQMSLPGLILAELSPLSLSLAAMQDQLTRLSADADARQNPPPLPPEPDMQLLIPQILDLPPPVEPEAVEQPEPPPAPPAKKKRRFL